MTIDWDKVIGGFLIFITIALVVGLAVGMYSALTDRTQDEFMAECIKEHKQYECTAMWRSGENHSTVVPMPVVVPVR
jgi:hypothetical protein